MSATILIGTGISASAFSHHFKGDVEIYEKASRVGGRLCARNYKEFIIQFGAQYATDKCARDLKIIVAAVAEDTARGGNSAIIEATNQYFDNHDALDGERTQSVYAFEYAKRVVY